MDSGLRVIAGRGHLVERVHRATVAALHEQALRRVPMPRVGVSQERDELFAIQLRKLGRCVVDGRSLVDDAVDPTKAKGLIQLSGIDLPAQVPADIGLVLDEPAIHVDEVQRTIRAGVRIDKTIAFVGRCQKLLAFIRGRGSGLALLVRAEDHALDKVARRLWNKDVVVVLARELRAAIDLRPARRGGDLEFPCLMVHDIGLVRPVDPGRRVRGPDVRLDLGDRRIELEVGVALGDAGREQFVFDRRGVAVGEDSAVIVLGDAPLPAELRVAVGAEAGADLLVATRGFRVVIPVVQPVKQPVGLVLDVALGFAVIRVRAVDGHLRAGRAVGVHPHVIQRLVVRIQNAVLGKGDRSRQNDLI